MAGHRGGAQTQAPTNAPRIVREAAAGAFTACLTLALCVAAGILVYSPFGADYVAAAALAGLLSAIIGGAVASVLCRSTFVTTIPTKNALIQASIAGGMVTALGDVD